MYRSCVLLLVLVAAMVRARPPPFYEEFSRICGQGQKTFTLLQFKENPEKESGKTVLLPRCIGWEPPACTRGCRWQESCEHSPDWQFQDGRSIFVAGLNTVLYQGGKVSKIEAWCCQSLSSNFDDCEWRKPIFSTTPTAVAGPNEIVRNIRSTDDEDKLGSLEVEVCKAVKLTDVCDNPRGPL